MRFVTLNLMAYGPFRDLSLDFSGGPGLHVLYGRNEAGKSTTRRAVLSLLYGIPKTTQDAHLHSTKDLRIGARLLANDGSTLDVVRRKGVGIAKTLLDLEGNVLEEAVLSRILGGVGEEVYGTTFGLDHETLRRGGEALLQGKGDLGESLFQAGLGGSEVHRVLEDLNAEADAIFTPQARTRPLNDALKAFSEGQKQTRDSALSADAWQKQKDDLDAAEALSRACVLEKTELKVEEKRLQRVQRVLPLLATRARLRVERDALGQVVPLPETAPAERVAALREGEESRALLVQLAAEIAEREGRRAELSVPESLMVDEAAVKATQERLHAHKTAAIELPVARGELDRLDDEARKILRRIDRELPLDKVETLRLDTATHARIKKLSREHSRLHDQVQAATKSAADIQDALDDLRAEGKDYAASADPEPLRRASDRARSQGDLDEQHRVALARTKQLADVADKRLRALGLWSGDLATARTVPVPVVESVDKFAQREAMRVQLSARLNDRKSEIDKRIADNAHATNALVFAGTVPTEDDLLAARTRRDDRFRGITESIKTKTPFDSTEVVRTYEQDVRDADALSDRLRREAEHVTRLAGLRADHASNEAASARLRTEETSLAAETAENDAAWRALWEPCGIVPLSPVEMRAWLGRHKSVLEAADQLSAQELETQQLAARIRVHHDELASASAGEKREAGEPLATLIARAAHLVATMDASARARQLNGDSTSKLTRDLEKAVRERDATSASVTAWEREWREATSSLRLSANATSEEVLAVLDDLFELFRLVDDAEKTRTRVRAIEREAAAFATDVAALVKRHAPDLDGARCDDAATELVKRHQHGREERTKRGEIDRALEEKRQASSEQTKRSAGSKERIASLMRAAHADSVEALEVAEGHAERLRVLARDLSRVEQQLLDLGEGADVEALVAESAPFTRDAAMARLDRIDERLPELEAELDKVNKHIGRTNAGFETLATSLAAGSAEDAQHALAKVRRLAERYVRVRLASIVLTREIERYREKNQGPVLGLASELHRRLTLGAYTGLRAGLDEDGETVLRSVRADGREVDIEALSDGTRDQLYLALRIASLDRYARANGPLPLVLDDILIHFDDDRARAALEILGELASLTQVLFFTHHARLVALAREAIPAATLRVHELGEPAARLVLPEARA